MCAAAGACCLAGKTGHWQRFVPILRDDHAPFLKDERLEGFSLHSERRAVPLLLHGVLLHHEVHVNGYRWRLGLRELNRPNEARLGVVEHDVARLELVEHL